MAEPTVASVLATAGATLRQAGIADGRYEARLLAAHVLGVDQSALLRDRDRDMPAASALRLATLVGRRVAREPMAHIIGHVGFWTLTLAVSAATLIPRADSETLIDAAIAAFPDRSRVRSVLDLGTGTGCLLLAALAEFHGAFGVGIDRSPAACRLAAANAAGNGLAARSAILCGDWTAAIEARFDLVLANPPYIPGDDIATLMPDVAAYEPASALDGGGDGLDAYRSLVPLLPMLLAPGGVAILELGAGQAPAVLALAAPFALDAATRADLAGHARALILRRREC